MGADDRDGVVTVARLEKSIDSVVLAEELLEAGQGRYPVVCKVRT